MKRRTILTVSEYWIKYLEEHGFTEQRAKRSYVGNDQRIHGNHALFMAYRVRTYIYTYHRDKAMRWLSALQDRLCGAGITSINTGKHLMRPKSKSRK